MIVARIDEEALYLPDITIGGMDVITTMHVCFPVGDNVLFHDRRMCPRPMPIPMPETTAAAHTTVGLDRLSLAVAALVIDTLRQVDLLGGIELVEIRDAAAQPDTAGRSVDQVNGDKPAFLFLVFGSMTRWVTVRAAGSIIRRLTLPQTPSEQLASAPIVNPSASAIATVSSRATARATRPIPRGWITPSG